MREDFSKTRILNGVQMHADNIASFSGTNQVLFIFMVCVTKVKQRMTALHFGFLNAENEKYHIQFKVVLIWKAEEICFSKGEILTFQTII